MQRLVDWSTLGKSVPFTRQHVLRLEKIGRFSKRVRIGDNKVAWFADEVEEWQEGRAKERDQEDSEEPDREPSDIAPSAKGIAWLTPAARGNVSVYRPASDGAVRLRSLLGHHGRHEATRGRSKAPSARLLDPRCNARAAARRAARGTSYRVTLCRTPFGNRVAL